MSTEPTDQTYDDDTTEAARKWATTLVDDLSKYARQHSPDARKISANLMLTRMRPLLDLLRIQRDETAPATEAPHHASGAHERGAGICWTCLAPIWNEGGTVGTIKYDAGWSDRNQERDSLVCFRAKGFRHEPLTGREANIYDYAYRLGAFEGR